ncbi:Ras-GAP domain-containing protein [Entamoeba marina]
MAEPRIELCSTKRSKSRIEKFCKTPEMTNTKLYTLYPTKSSTSELTVTPIVPDEKPYSPQPNSSLNKKSQEEQLRKLLFCFPSDFLIAYSNALLKGEPNPFHITELLKFFSSRGRLTDLLTNLAYTELETINIHNELFRGNTPFTKVFSTYLHRYCSDYLSQTTHKLLASVNSTTSIDEILMSFSKILTQTRNQFPCHLKIILQKIHSTVSVLRGTSSARRAIATLLFLRYIFTPLTQSPSILKVVQRIVSEVANSSKSRRDAPPGIHEMMLACEQLLESVVNGPTGYGMSRRGISEDDQEKSLISLIAIIRHELKHINNYYVGDFEEVFAVVKGKADPCVGMNVAYVTKEFTSWMDERELAVIKENNDLRFEVDKLQKDIRKLKQTILLVKKGVL